MPFLPLYACGHHVGMPIDEFSLRFESQIINLADEVIAGS